VLLAWVVIPLGLMWTAPSWDKITRDGDFAYLPDRMTSSRGRSSSSGPSPTRLPRVKWFLVVARHGGKLRQADLAVAGRLAEQFSPKAGATPTTHASTTKTSPIKAAWTYDEPVWGPS